MFLGRFIGVKGMREIKFRGKRVDNKEWVCGSLCIADDKAFIVYDNDFYEDEDCCGKHLISDRYCEVDPATVGQCSGQHDKNGWEIYEGDVVRWFSETLPISRCKMHARFLIGNDLLSKGAALDSEVVANIHDNPELPEE